MKSTSEPVDNKYKLTKKDWIVDAFFDKYKAEERKNWVLKEEHIPEIISNVNKKKVNDWIMLGWAFQAELIELNLRKSNKKVPNYDIIPMDSQGSYWIKEWAKEKELG